MPARALRPTGALEEEGKQSWRACYTRARHEKKVRTRLERAGFDVFLPIVPQERQWHDRVETVEMPLFPGYLFVRFGERQLEWVMRTAGIATVVRFQDELASVPSDEIDNVRRLVAGFTDSGLPVERQSVVETGDRVRVIEGPFEGVEGVVAERRGDGRVLVAGSETLGQGLKLELGAGFLRRLS